MAGLTCGEPNTRAYRMLRQYAAGVFSCADQIAALGMRILGNPLGDDPKMIAGESGAVPIGLLYYLRTEESCIQICTQLSLNEKSRVLLINTEGDTDSYHYQNIVWKGHYPIE